MAKCNQLTALPFKELTENNKTPQECRQDVWRIDAQWW